MTFGQFIRFNNFSHDHFQVFQSSWDLLIVDENKRFTFPIFFEGSGRPGRAKSFSTPPVSFQCMSFLVGGARSRVVMISEVSASCIFIVSLVMPFCSSTTSFRFRLAFLSVPIKFLQISLKRGLFFSEMDVVNHDFSDQFSKAVLITCIYCLYLF